MARRQKREGRKLTPAQKRQVKLIVGRDVEKKFFDKNMPGNAPTGSGLIVGSVINIAQGNNDTGRIGDKITLKQMKIRTTITGADATNFVRLIWFQWTPLNSVQAPSLSTLMQDPITWNSPLNESNGAANLYRVISDKIYSCSLSGSTAARSFTTVLYGRKIPRKQIEYQPSQATGYNQIYCAMYSDSTATAHPTVSVYMRTMYTDQ